MDVVIRYYQIDLRSEEEQTVYLARRSKLWGNYYRAWYWYKTSNPEEFGMMLFEQNLQDAEWLL